MAEGDWMTRVLVVDLEGTLADNRARMPLLESREFEAYEEASSTDVLNRDIGELIDVWGDSTVVITTRSEKYRTLTEGWFKKAGVLCHALLMRPEGNWSPEYLLKPKLIDDYFGSREAALGKVIAVIDDSDQVCTSFKQEGFKVWQKF